MPIGERNRPGTGVCTGAIWGDYVNSEKAGGYTTVSASAVYYAQGSQASAETIATSLGLSSSAVQPLTTSVPVSSTTGASVVLVIGPDLAGKTPGGGATTT